MPTTKLRHLQESDHYEPRFTMLAAHRDQENLVHSHQVPTKQNPKTPGARYPKTPSRFRDENAPSAFAGKSTVVGTLGGQEKTVNKGAAGRQALMTPMGNPNRAVLGNKTTNAKARAGQTGGVKGIPKDLERTTTKLTTVQKPRQRAAEVAPIKFDVKQDKEESQEEEEEEPEYAPPPVEPQPYESDVLPLGLTFEGLKEENLLRGYYDYYHNPVDANGISRKDKQLEEEMEKLVERATERNERDLADLDWSNRKDPDAAAKPPASKALAPKPSATTSILQRNPATITSRRAAAALAQAPEIKKKPALRTTAAATARRPLSSLIRGPQPKRTVPVARDPPAGPSATVASRTTLGYTKGRTASSVVHPRRNVASATNKTSNELGVADEMSEQTITPARAKAALRRRPAPISPTRPQFLSIFDGHDDDDDLPPQNIPQYLLEDDDEEFELRLDI
ncbi:hypothetical protein CC79DRAFT_1364261 [Sarocladium strictum]